MNFRVSLNVRLPTFVHGISDKLINLDGSTANQLWEILINAVTCDEMGIFLEFSTRVFKTGG
jgi:hypothetical protein